MIHFFRARKILIVRIYSEKLQISIYAQNIQTSSASGSNDILDNMIWMLLWLLRDKNVAFMLSKTTSNMHHIKMIDAKDYVVIKWFKLTASFVLWGMAFQLFWTHFRSTMYPKTLWKNLTD